MFDIGLDLGSTKGVRECFSTGKSRFGTLMLKAIFDVAR